MERTVFNFYALFTTILLLLAGVSSTAKASSIVKEPVDYVNPYMGNISHLLVPTFPTVHLPNSMLRVYPERDDYTSDLLRGLPVIVTSHRGRSAFNISPVQESERPLTPVVNYSYDLEKVTPYSYEVYLDEKEIEVHYAPSHQAGIYEINFEKEGNNLLIFNTYNGELSVSTEGVSGYQDIGNNTKVYVYFETEQKPISYGILFNGKIEKSEKAAIGRNKTVALNFGAQKTIRLRYGVSFIDVQQAQRNLKREISTYDYKTVQQTARDIWNKTLGKIQIQGGTENEKTVFYTSLYRTYERMINISEDGRFFSAFDGGNVHEDNGIPFYTDDWVWDTYRAVHPLRILIEPEMEQNIIRSYIRMAEQSKEDWMPTFPEITGDSHRMNSNHAASIVWDAYSKGLKGFDLQRAYMASKKAVTEATLIPWTRAKAGVLDDFYKEKGYFPALKIGEVETVKEVNKGEKRQPVAVTLGTSFDCWCLAQIAKALKLDDDYHYFLKASYNYRNLYNSETGFFHPKDEEGNFIQPFDYRFSGGQGARDYYDENNGWTYRWDVPHNPADLIRLMGSPENFVKNLDQTFREPLGKSKFEFYSQLPDQTGNVGQFTMGNEPSLHIPYLYNYAGQPWKTQKRIRELLKLWFRNDLMGVPGDEDGGGMSAFVVFSSMGFYPVTPGSATYNIGSPLFEHVTITLNGGKVLEIEAQNCSDENKYIQSASLNGKKWDKPWFSHSDIVNGGKLVLVMGNKANRQWGASPNDAPPSAENSEQATAPVSKVDRPWMNPNMPLEKRVDAVLSAMTPNDKMELLREDWGIPGIPRLGIPDIKKVEAVHGFSYGSGATIFPQALALAASWNKQLVEEVAGIIGDETVAAGAVQAWSPVLDVAQDARWGRCEETFGEDPVLVSLIGGAWIKAFQSKGLIATPKHFAAHGAILGGRDSHDIGLSEREIREVHLVPFREVIRKYGCQSIMIAYSDFLGVPVAKNKELLKGILREEWGFDGFLVSDCGAIGNLTARKHYTAKDVVEAANEALAAGIATNCGDTYNNKDVIAAANNGGIDMESLDYTCRTMLRTMFRNGFFENNPSRPLDWNKQYPGWQSPEHIAAARKAACQSIVLLENKNKILPLPDSFHTIAVIGPGADDMQIGDYSPNLQKGQLKSVLTGIKAAVGNETKIIYEKGCEFMGDDESYDPENAKKAALQSDVVVMVLGDCSIENRKSGLHATSGENHDCATLELSGNQQKLLEAVCETGKPVVLILQVGRPYAITYASEHCAAILVNWFPGQEGGYAAADVLFGKVNPAGRLPMTFPRHVGQLPDYYNFKTSGRRYEYSDMEYYPLYSFGYGLSYTQFKYSGLQTSIHPDGTVGVEVNVTNTGDRTGDEVVQLYVTDMYADVKTRIMELKDFERITLAPGEMRKVSFTLTPYQLSLLNENMDRAVEPGAFKIMVGGRSPSYRANDRIKDSVGYLSDIEGVSTAIDYTKTCAADFQLSYVGIEDNDGKRQAAVKIRNAGNITDAGKVYLFMNGIQAGEIHHYELDSNEDKIIRFDLDKKNKINELTFTTKYKSITINPSTK